LAGLWHDQGKYNSAFQQYLIDAHEGRGATSTPHAIYGALLAAGQGIPELGQVIAGHHTGMPSLKEISNAFSDPVIRLTYENVRAVAPEVEDATSTLKVGEDLRGEVLLRMVFSCLVDADYVDTERHFDPERAPPQASLPCSGPRVPRATEGERDAATRCSSAFCTARPSVASLTTSVARLSTGRSGPRVRGTTRR
jgi:CRISPR-associated endonuclease/helicase Cas3